MLRQKLYSVFTPTSPSFWSSPSLLLKTELQGAIFPYETAQDLKTSVHLWLLIITRCYQRE